MNIEHPCGGPVPLGSLRGPIWSFVVLSTRHGKWHFSCNVDLSVNASCSQTVIDNDKSFIPHICGWSLITHVNFGGLQWSRIQMGAKEQRGLRTASIWQEAFFGGQTLFAHGSAVRPPRDPRFSAVMLLLPTNQIPEAGACTSFG